VVNQIASMLFGYQEIVKKVKKKIKKFKMKICLLLRNGKKLNNNNNNKENDKFDKRIYI